MEWPCQFADMNLIQIMWKDFKWAVQTENPPVWLNENNPAKTNGPIFLPSDVKD